MSRNFELLQQGEGGQELFLTSGAPAQVAALPAINKPAPAPRKEVALETPSSPAPVQWLGLIKDQVRQWREQLQSLERPRATGVDAMTRKEEMKLVQRVFGAVNGRSPQVVLFSAVDGGPGSAAICGRAGQILAAQPGERVCLVDADLRAPFLHRLFGVENSKGLAEALLETDPIGIYARQIAGGNLWVLPGGITGAQFSVSLLADRLQARIAELRAAFRHVLIHSAAPGVDSDLLSLSRCTDGVVLVLEANSTRRETARRVKEALEAGESRVLGIVLNQRTFPIPDALYRKL